MSHSSTKKQKPKKPYQDFPLFPHSCGQWAKKIKGKTRYFGLWNDPDQALNNYLREKDWWYAGLIPPNTFGGLDFDGLQRWYIDAQYKKLCNEEITKRHYSDCVIACKQILDYFGKKRTIDSITPNQMGEFRDSLAKGRNPQTLSNVLQRIRSVFNYVPEACKNEQLPELTVDMKALKSPTKANIRRFRNKLEDQYFTPKEIRKLIRNAIGWLKPAILLGINCGFGNTDVSSIPMDRVDLEGGFHNYGRPKSGIDRQASLWPETIEAIDHWLTIRPRSELKNLFLTAQKSELVRNHENGSKTDNVTVAFRTLRTACDIHKKGHGFYVLRHVYKTVAEYSGLPHVVNRTMGHESSNVEEAYRAWVGNQVQLDGFKTVANYVRNWVYEE